MRRGAPVAALLAVLMAGCTSAPDGCLPTFDRADWHEPGLYALMPANATAVSAADALPYDGPLPHPEAWLRSATMVGEHDPGAHGFWRWGQGNVSGTARSQDQVRFELGAMLRNLTAADDRQVEAWVRAALANETVHASMVLVDDPATMHAIAAYHVHVPARARLPEELRSASPDWPRPNDTFYRGHVAGETKWGGGPWRFTFGLPHRSLDLGGSTLRVDVLDAATVEGDRPMEDPAVAAAAMRKGMQRAGIASEHPGPDELSGPAC